VITRAVATLEVPLQLPAITQPFPPQAMHCIRQSGISQRAYSEPVPVQHRRHLALMPEHLQVVNVTVGPAAPPTPGAQGKTANNPPCVPAASPHLVPQPEQEPGVRHAPARSPPHTGHGQHPHWHRDLLDRDRPGGSDHRPVAVHQSFGHPSDLGWLTQAEPGADLCDKLPFGSLCLDGRWRDEDRHPTGCTGSAIPGWRGRAVTAHSHWHRVPAHRSRRP
jgi:hypothetical protein